MNKKIKIILPIIITIIILSIVSLIIMKNSHQQESNYEILVDVGESDKMFDLDDKGLKLSEVSFEKKKSTYDLSIRITNYSGVDITETKKIKILFLDKDGKEVYQLNKELKPIENNASRNMVFSLVGDYSNTKSFKLILED